MTAATKKPNHLSAVPSKPAAPTKFTPKTYKPNGPMAKRVAAAMRIKFEIERLEAELEEHKQVLLKHVNEKGISRLDVGDFQVQRKKHHNWTYSVKVQNEMLLLAQKQRNEQANGVAKDNPTVYIAFTVAKKATAQPGDWNMPGK